MNIILIVISQKTVQLLNTNRKFSVIRSILIIFINVFLTKNIILFNNGDMACTAASSDKLYLKHSHTSPCKYVCKYIYFYHKTTRPPLFVFGLLLRAALWYRRLPRRCISSFMFLQPLSLSHTRKNISDATFITFFFGDNFLCEKFSAAV